MSIDFTISKLIAAHLRGETSEAENATLNQWMAESAENAAFLSALEDKNIVAQKLALYENMNAGNAWWEIVNGIEAEKKSNSTRAAHRVHFLKTAWFRYAAAIIILFGIGTYLWNTKNNSATITQTEPVPIKNDVLPGSDRAILTLADGKQIALDSNANMLLAKKGISNKDALIAYTDKEAPNVINTLATPKGGQYKIKLSDGTMVWLNAASSITYPTNFTGKAREVNVTGEVYFQVVKNKEKPFKVKTSRDEITVLGTEFNVNSYNDEPKGKISLIQGAVKVNERILEPGQAYIEGKIIATNIEQDVAWKNGVFDFNKASVEVVMRQLERWYNIDVQYAGPVPQLQFYGKIGRDLNLSQVLRLLGGAGLKFSEQGSTIIIK